MSGARVELAVRFRCATCRMAIERLDYVDPPQFPALAKISLHLPLPDGWTAEGGQLFCPRDEPKRIVPALVVPAAAAGRR